MKNSVLFVFLILVFGVTAFSQTPDAEVKTFDKDGLKFSYPADWTLADKSNDEFQILSLSKSNSLALISITSPRQIIENYEQYRVTQNLINDRYVIAIKQGLNTSDKPTGEESMCLDFNGRNVIGMRFTGLYKNESSTGDVFPFVLGNRFINLVYMRVDKSQAAVDPVWKGLIASLYLQNAHKDADKLSFEAEAVASGELNSRAIGLAQPNYTSDGLRRGYPESVTVRVVVDENGKVIQAEAGAASEKLRMAAIQAAKLSKFRPSAACGKPVKITGIIVYKILPDYVYLGPRY